MRTYWKNGFPAVVVHQRYETLKGCWNYHLAKKHGNARHALKICDELHNEDALGRLYDLMIDVDPAPIVVVPARPLGPSGNALGRMFARYVGQDLGFEVTNEIIQTNAVKRDHITSPFVRMSQCPTFDGRVKEGANYLLVDDVLTLGGTLASLRGFIESKSGIVVGMTVLAEKEGIDAKIALETNTVDMLRKVDHGALAALVPERTGFALECLTEREGQYLLQQSSAHEIRAGFDRAADG